MSLLEMSISGAIMILAVAVIRFLAINRLPKKTFIALWGVVLLRLLVPFSFPSPFSAYSLVNSCVATPQGIATIEPIPIFPPQPVAFPTVERVIQAQAVASISPYVIIWAVGVIACTLFFTVSYFKCHREFQESLPIKNDFLAKWLEEHKLVRKIEIRQSSRISAPLTYGVLKPIILMPKNTKWADTTQIEYILAHEFIHVRRFDAAAKLLLTAALCVHWFNPLVWAMYILSNRDIELSCDEAVVRSFGETTKSTYALTLISMEEKKSTLTPLCNSFSKNAIEERITAIMKMKKTSLVAVVIAVVLIVGVTTAFATSATSVSAMGTTQNSTAISPIRISDKDIAAGGKISLGTQLLAAGTDCKVLLTFIGDNKLTILCTSADGTIKSLPVESGKAATLQIEVGGEYTISVKNSNAQTISNVNGTIEFVQSEGQQSRINPVQLTGESSFDNNKNRPVIDLASTGSFRVTAGSGPQQAYDYSESKQTDFIFTQGQKLQIDVDYISAFHTTTSVNSIKLIFVDSQQHTEEVIIKKGESGEIIFKNAGVYSLSIQNDEAISLYYSFILKNTQSSPTSSITSNVDTVTYKNVEMRRYEGTDGHPYIHDTKVNETTKKIAGYKYGMLAFDKDGNPLKIDWWSLDTESESTYFYLSENSIKIAPDETYDVSGGWSLNFYGTDSSVEKIAYVLYCDKEITFEDGTVWSNSNFDSWRSSYEGKKVDVNILKSYYPYKQKIAFTR